MWWFESGAAEVYDRRPARQVNLLLAVYNLHYTALPKLWTTTSTVASQHRAHAASDRPLDRHESAATASDRKALRWTRIAGWQRGEAETRLIGKAHAPNKAQPDDNSPAEAEGKAE
jgi:hypothetical protein